MNHNRTVIFILLAISLGSISCGYRVRSSVGTLPEGIRSLGIPAFQNLTNEFKIEQIFTDAVIRQFNRRTRIKIRTAEPGADAVLRGEIRSVHSVPVTFGSRSFGTAYMVSVETGVQLIRLEDMKVIWQEKKFTFRERYTLNSDVRDFFDEENPALERLADAFASSLVGTILESQSLDSSKP